MRKCRSKDQCTNRVAERASQPLCVSARRNLHADGIDALQEKPAAKRDTIMVEKDRGSTSNTAVLIEPKSAEHTKTFRRE